MKEIKSKRFVRKNKYFLKIDEKGDIKNVMTNY